MDEANAKTFYPNVIFDPNGEEYHIGNGDNSDVREYFCYQNGRVVRFATADIKNGLPRGWRTE